MHERKKPWKSKTNAAAVALPLLTLIPGVRDVVSSHPQESMGVVSLLMIGLRALTGKSIGL